MNDIYLEQLINEIKYSFNSKLLYTTKELAELLGFKASVDIVHQLRKSGAIHAIKRGRAYLFTRKEVERFLEVYFDADISNATTIKREVLQRNKKGLPERPPSKKESPKSNNRINNPIRLYHENGKIKIV